MKKKKTKGKLNILKLLKKKAREEIGPIPAVRVHKDKKKYARKRKRHLLEYLDYF